MKKESKLREQRRMAGILTFVDPDYDEAKARARHKHHVIQTEVCVQCGFQIGSKWCTLCRDNYCDTCFDDQHLKGNLQTHQDHFEWTVDPCEDCGERAARYAGNAAALEAGVVETEHMKLCVRCARTRLEDRAGGPPAGWSLKSLEKLPLETRVMRAFFEEADEIKNKAEAHRLHEKRLRELKLQRQEADALTIQRVWRGVVARSGQDRDVRVTTM